MVRWLQISSKISLSISAVLLCAGIIGYLGLQGQVEQQREEFRETSEEAVKLLAVAIAPDVAERSHDRTQAIVDAIANFRGQYPNVRDLEVISSEGDVIASWDPRRFNVKVDTAPFGDALNKGKPASRQKGDLLEVIVPLQVTHRLGVVRAELAQERMNRRIASQQQWALGLLLGTILAVGAALTLAHRRMVGLRLTALAAKASALGGGKMEVRAEAKGDDEISALGGSFNQMASALQLYTEDLEQIIEERTEELQEANKRLETLATTDQLTGLCNRRHFDEFARRTIAAARRSGRPVSLVLIDTDRFKSVNDRFGHPAGDEILRDVAACLTETARKADMVARVGGEEFAVLMPDASLELAAQAAERMRAELAAAAHPNVPELGDEAITASFGVASLDTPEHRLEDLYSAADQAMYRSKTEGRNRVTLAGDEA